MGCTSPFPRFLRFVRQQESGSPKGEGALASPRPLPQVWGSHRLWRRIPGGPSLRGLGGPAVYGISGPSPPPPHHPVGVRSVQASLRAPAAAADRAVGLAWFAQWAERRLREWSLLRRAALRCCAGRRGPRRGGAGRIFGLSLSSPRPTGGALPRKEKRHFQGYLRHPAPLAWGSPFVHLAPLGRGSDFAFAARAARRGPLPTAPVGKFPPLPWHPALVAGGGLAQHPAGPGVQRTPRARGVRGRITALQPAAPAGPGLPWNSLNWGPQISVGIEKNPLHG